MTLPFNSDSKFKRKYQCFVCALQFELFEEMAAHIVEKYEEGRDFVKCPLARCAAPVRDVRAHWKAKHPGQTMPHVGAMKAMVWRDVTPNGKIKNRKPKFREGYFESVKMAKQFHYRSGWEATVFELLDTWNEVIAYDVEPFEIPYIHDGAAHKYIPDLFIAFLDGHKEVWEIKPSNQTSQEKNQNKWFSAQRACEARGWGFEVVTEQVIEKLKKKVRNQHLTETDEPDIE